ncbi:ferro-o2-oxidoreductase [Trichoderma arundinaceum]|uniref:Ferro-o2-oxidoreductase n=1 Tax=Trichoderma arundinaceum TaxID=490622 RepID=A0A395P0U4_TRIAR|nr:ferro-o2-oxidoreductase [Trichoderma arundinaceum]
MRDQDEERRLLDEVDTDSDDVATQLSINDEAGEIVELEPVASPKSSFTLLRIVGLVVALCLGSLVVVLFAMSRHAGAPFDDSQLAIPLHPTEHSTRDPTTLTFEWHVTLGTKAPDGVEKQVYLVNAGQFPGPTIEGRSGDRIIVHVYNDLADEGVSLHWHGLRMQGFNAMDGAVGFTQCPVPAGSSFVYDFRIRDDEHGTFWWHSHSQLQRADGLFGGLVIHEPRPHDANIADQQEALLLIGDWFHRKQSDVLDWYTSPRSAGNEPVPDSMIINGRGRLEQLPTSYPKIYQRNTAQSGEYRNLRFGNPALNPNHTFPALPTTATGHDRDQASPLKFSDVHLNLATLSSKDEPSPIVTAEEEQTVLFYVSTQKLAVNGNKPIGFVNHTFWQPQPLPLLSQNRSSWDDHQFIPFIGSGSKPTKVKLVINNLDDGSHPFHLHGYSFSVLSSFRAESGSGFGSYNPYDTPESDSPGQWNREKPLRKDTISVPRKGHVVLTFVADNPGMWMLHCHMLVHLGTGMATGFQVGVPEDEEHLYGMDESAARLCKASN